MYKKFVFFIAVITFFSTKSNTQELITDSVKAFSLLDSAAVQKYAVVMKYKDIPKFIRHTLNHVKKQKVKMADAGKDFNAGDFIVNSRLPSMQLSYAAITTEYAIITYRVGGFGSHVMATIMHFWRKKIISIAEFRIAGRYKTLDDLIENIKQHRNEKYFSIET